jgi:hypothetical protein
MSKNISGVSISRFDSYSKKVKIVGWFLSRDPIDKILVYYGDNIMLGKATLKQSRPDVFKRYPQYNDPNAGFILETTTQVDLPGNSPVYIKIFSKNTLIHTIKSKLIFDDMTRAHFRELLKNNTVYFNYIPNINIDPGKMNRQEFDYEIKKIDVEFQDYKQWFARINYEKNYPKYVKEFPVGDFLNRKSLQHYISIKLLGSDKDEKRDEIYLDVASSNSVFPDILTGEYKVKKVYRHDWLYKKGIHGDRIGSNAIDIPLPGHSADKITLHCSWEHFEGNSDVEFFKEAHRILKENGKLCIIPLYLAEEYFAITSPAIWREKYSRAITIPPEFEKGMIVCIMEQIKQRQHKYYDLKTLSKKILQPFKDIFDFEIIHFTNYKDHPGCPVFALNAARKS